jgi:GNAT superfamily N-acetyltransferase
VLEALQQYLRRVAGEGREIHRVGPFAVHVQPDSDHAHLNYAIPDAGASPSPQQVEALLATFARLDRTPRLEYLPALAPDVAGALAPYGIGVEGRLALMTCTPADRVPVPTPEGVTLVDVDRTREPGASAALRRTQAVAFGMTPDDGGDGRDDPFDHPAVLALVDGTPAGGGQCLAVLGGTTELAGIGTAPAFRRRGVAAAVTGRLADRAFAAGATLATLAPGDEDTARIYARCGFSTCGEMLHLRAG